MFGISSQLASQTINKNTIWKCLLRLERVEGELTQEIANCMTIEGWAVGVWVVIKRCGDRKGLSTIISAFHVAFEMVMETERKSQNLNVIRYSDRLFLVDSAQDPNNKHFVTAQPDSLTCSCMKFKCLKNRMTKEAPQLVSALGELKTIDESKFCVTNNSQIHIQCHHIRAVMREAFEAYTSTEYQLNWKRVMRNNTTNRQAKDIDFLPELGEFRPKNR